MKTLPGSRAMRVRTGPQAEVPNGPGAACVVISHTDDSAKTLGACVSPVICV